jgi:predicted Zn-dependent protease
VLRLRLAICFYALCTIAACSDAPAQTEDTPLKISSEEKVESIDATLSEDEGYATFGEILARHLNMSARVERISRALRVANAPLCDLTRPDLGLTTHSLSDYPEGLRTLALYFLPLGEEGDYVRAVVPGSPADLAGARSGDRVVSGWPLSAGRPLILDSGEALFQLEHAAETACDIPAFVIPDERPNASTDGVEIELSTTLIEQVGDDSALAFIIAHEMAHVIRGHSAPSWAVELQADKDALILMQNAGFDVTGTVAGWETGVEAHRQSQSFSQTHPPIEIRLKNLRDALGTLNADASDFVALPAED